MSHKKEIEIDLAVKDVAGLLKFLRSLSKEEEIKGVYHYFERANDDSFYLRLERKFSGDLEELLLTVKSSFVLDENGLKIRDEITTKISSIDELIKVCELIGLESKGVKSKLRRKFLIENMEVVLDEWYEGEFEKFLELNCEIEGDDKERILQFKEKLKPFIESTPKSDYLD